MNKFITTGIVIIIIFLTLSFGYKFFPDNLLNSNNFQYLIYLFIILIVLLSGRRFKNRLGYNFKIFTLWIVIIIAITLSYNYRFKFKTALEHLSSSFVPSRPINNNDKVIINKSSDGHFYVRAIVNEQNVEFMVDTGASLITLTKDAAQRVGIDVANLKFNSFAQTANGISRTAPIILRKIMIGNITLYNVRATVNEGKMDKPLLGMNFLDNLKSYEVSQDKMTLIGKP